MDKKVEQRIGVNRGRRKIQEIEREERQFRENRRKKERTD